MMLPRHKNCFFFYGFAFIFLSVFSPFALGQTSLFQDAKGESSIILADKSLISINTGDASIGFSYAHFQSKISKYWGFNIELKTEEGISYVLKNETLSLNSKIGFLYGRRNTSRNRIGITDDYYLSSDISLSAFKLFDDQKSYDKQIIEESSLGFSAKMGWNRVSSSKFLSKDNTEMTTTIFGISLGAGLTNNLDKLNKVSISNYSLIKDEESSKSRLIQGTSITAFSPYPKYDGKLGFIQLNIDYAIIPNLFANRMLLIVFSRNRFSTREKAKWNPGIGVFLTKDGAPLEGVCGIQFQITDLLNSERSDKKVLDRATISFVAGFSFNM